MRKLYTGVSRLCLIVLAGIACCNLAAGQSMTESATVHIAAGSSGEDIQKLIDGAIASHATDIRFAPGTYRIAESLNIRKARNLTIHGEGATLVMEKFETILQFEGCDKLVLTGMTFDYDPLPFTQGTVTAVSTDGKSIDFRIHDGYSEITADYNRTHVHLFDPATRHWKRDVPDFYPRSVSMTGTRTARAEFEDARKEFSVGDLIALDIRSRATSIMSRRCGEMRFEGTTHFAAPGLTIGGRYATEQHVYRKVKIAPGPRPAGATEDRLLSSSADGINYAYCRKGPLIEECDFAFQGDDSVNVHGALLPVMKSESENTILFARADGVDESVKLIHPGDTVRVIMPGNFAVKATGVIASLEPLKSPGDITREEVAAAFPSRKKVSNISVYRITFTTPVPAQAGEWIDIPAINCPEFIIRNNYFHDHRARGLRVMGNNGLIENNRFERLTHAAISIGAEYGYWREAGWVEDVIVRGNSILDVGTGTAVSDAGAMVPGAIAIFVHADPGDAPAFQGNRDIVIEGNVIDGCSVSGVHASGAAHLVVRNNTMRRINTRKPGQAVSIVNSSDVTIEGNSIP